MPPGKFTHQAWAVWVLWEIATRLCCPVRLAGYRTAFVASTTWRISTSSGMSTRGRVGSDTTAMTPASNPVSILESFRGLARSPPRTNGQIHRLDEIVFIATCGVSSAAPIPGCRSPTTVTPSSDWLETFLTLPGGIPSHDTFRRVFCRLDPVAFQKGFSAWITALRSSKRIDSDRHGSARTDTDRHRRQGPTRLRPAYRRPIGVPVVSPGRSRII